MKHLSSCSIVQTSTLLRKALASLVLPLASLALIGMHSSAQAQAITNPNSITRVSSFEYNAQGLLTKEIIEPDSPQLCLSATHGYDNRGNKTSVSTAACAGASGAAISSASAPRAASTVYSADGRFPERTTNALGHSETKTYDLRFGLVSSLTGPNGLTTTWEYDGFGRKTRETRADGTYSTWEYKYCSDAGANCPTSLLAQGAGSNTAGVPAIHIPSWVVTERLYGANNFEIGPYKRQYHDALNRVIRVETLGFSASMDPFAAPVIVQDTSYNHLGQVRRKSNTYNAADPSSAVWVAYTYDALGRLIKEEAPDDRAIGGVATTLISYNGLQSTIINSQGQSKITVKDALGRTALVTDAMGGTVSYDYDALGQLIQTDAAGNITQIQYNLRGQKVAMQDPAMGVWEYQYNVFGELVYQSDSLGQSSTIAYDVLGRMVQRNEPDLTSVWVYDNCTKGIGKLCRASTLDGTGATDYNRVHSYDPLGRPSTTSTRLDTTVTTTVTYEVTTGRVANQTYPTGYQASYTYTQLGFLKSVTGQGSGTAQAKYEILAINAQGQITSYKYGNQVITNKTYDAKTGRLQAITGTKEGLATGGIQQNTYQYDSLSNLTARGDVNTGVQETFLYDNLNRLTNYQAVGGSITALDASSNVDVRYDARGNIIYKSDVGRYWYDPQRPNRLTNITLESMPGAAALTGTRALAYAFDDYKAGARTLGSGMGPASGSVMGNGNLWYTVSQDHATGRHTIRWETYTSFNMPKELALNSLGQAQTSTVATQTGSACPAGSTQVGSDCVTPANTSIPATPTYACPSGWTLAGSLCVVYGSGTLVNPNVISTACIAGGSTVTSSLCRVNVPATTSSCSNNIAAGQFNVLTTQLWTTAQGQKQCEYRANKQCPSNTVPYGSSICAPVTAQSSSLTGYQCPAGTTAAGSSCLLTQTQTVALSPIYSCPAGSTLSGNRCYSDATSPSTAATQTGLSCPVGSTLVGGTCQQEVLTAGIQTGYSCPNSNQTLNGSSCTSTTTQAVLQTTTAALSCNPSYYTLSGSGANATCGYTSTSCSEAGCDSSTVYVPVTRTCPASYALVGYDCQRTINQTITLTAVATPVYGCAAGQTLINQSASGACQTTQNIGAPSVPVYSCPAGSTLSGSRCFAGNITSSTATNRTLTFTYGPEHQRITQRTQLDSTAPANMSAAPGVVYYLNGQNNNLSYEKEVKDNGLIEHKHYLSAGGIVFAMQITRSGNLATGGTGGAAKPASTLQYLHHDHLGSVAVVTDETGSVAERLAYDPWGKRRFTNIENAGQADTTDSIVGLTLDRGFTMHEHLDEMGVIHMNGRIYDPLIGRFMSADPFIQAPENLQSHNRFAYVMNNPLSYTDPSGYFFKKLFKAVIRIFAAIADLSGCGGNCTMAVNAAFAAQKGGSKGLLSFAVNTLVPGSGIGDIAVRAAANCAIYGGNGCFKHSVVGEFKQGLQSDLLRELVRQTVGPIPEPGTQPLGCGIAFCERKRDSLESGFPSARDYISTLGPIVVAAGECAVTAPCAAAAAGIATRLFQMGRSLLTLSRIFTMNEAAEPEAGNGTDAAKPRDGEAGGPGAGKDFSDRTKDRIRDRDDNRCVFCNKDTTDQPGPDRSEIDHAHPKGRGGNNTDNNGQNTCRTCNRQKGGKTTEEYVEWLNRFLGK